LQNAVIFRKPQAAQLGSPLFRASCPPPFGSAALFKLIPDDFIFGYFLLAKKKVTRTR